MKSQQFPFSAPTQGVQQVTQAGTVTGVPLDGSGTVLVPFPQAFSQICQSVNVTYNPLTETDYQVVAAVIGVPTVSGFYVAATGGPIASTGPITWTAVGI